MGRRAVCAAIALLLTSACHALYPVVVWHELGGSCCESTTLDLVTWLKEYRPDAYVRAIRIGDSPDADRHFSYFDDANRQLAEVCADLEKDPALSDGFNMIGLSQGGLMSRALVHRCGETLRVHRLITVGSPLQGVETFPGCGVHLEQVKRWYPARLVRSMVRAMRRTMLSCAVIMAVVGRSIYSNFAQSRVMPAQYYKDPAQLSTYRAVNNFLIDINNERHHKNAKYRENFMRLDKLVIFHFAHEDVVHPKESTNFGYTDGTRAIPMRELPMYKEDWIGLRALDERGAITQVELPGEHLEITRATVRTILRFLD